MGKKKNDERGLTVRGKRAAGIGLAVFLIAVMLLVAMVPAVSADIYAYEVDEGAVAFEIKEKTPLQKLFSLLSFVGVSSFNVGSGVDTTASPWVVTGKKTTFEEGEAIYALVVLHNVEESVEIAIRMQDRYGRDVLGFTHTIPDPGTAYYPWYAVYPQDEAKLPVLQINPTPDNVLRALFLIKPLDSHISILEPPEPEPFVRNGFVVVEWGVVSTY